MTRLIAGLIVLFAIASHAPADAHPLDVGYLRIDASKREITFALDIDVNAAAHVLGIEPDAMTAERLARDATKVAQITHQRALITTELGACAWTKVTGTLVKRTASIAGGATCPSGATTRRWSFPFVLETTVSPTFQLLVKVQGPGSEQVIIVDKSKSEIELGQSASVSLTGFLWSGIEHIGATPSQWHDAGGLKLADGIDHILFLIALLIGGGKLQLAGIATGFTLGHSITLALSALDIIRPPPWLIEPIIALSIALAAADAFFGKFKEHRWKVATGFGLVHGFGFAAALNELGLSTGDMVAALFGYNLGVELGQLAIVLVTVPLVFLLQRNARAQTIVVRSIATVIFVAGMFWFVKRIASAL